MILKLNQLEVGALSHWDPVVVCTAAKHCLQMWDTATDGSKCNHVQARRFLDTTFGQEGDPPLRSLVEELAAGNSVEAMVRDNSSDPKVASLVSWLSALRLATHPN